MNEAKGDGPRGTKHTVVSWNCEGLLGGDMSTTTILIILLVLLLVGALPAWPYSGGWGYYPSGGLGLVLLILIVLLLLGRI